MNLEKEYLNIVIALVAIFTIANLLFRKKRPPTDEFVCARCKKNEKYTDRTIQAWKKGFKKIYCQSCHQLWLLNNPQHKAPASGGGCLSVLFFCALIPASIYGVIHYVSWPVA